MTCPKCKSENQEGNFCSNCGNKLKEKCPECGEMEPIGRPVCETRLEQAESKRYDYTSRRLKNWFLFEALSIFFVMAIVALHFGQEPPIKIPTIIGSSTILTIFIVFQFNVLAEARREKEFLVKFPAEAEILRKGGIIK
jgi:hypothetical protein